MQKFLHFIDPLLSFIDTGKVFRRPIEVVYGLIAVLLLIAPVFIFISAAKNGIFRVGFSGVMSFLLLWLVIVFACWVAFQLWWNRKNQLAEHNNEGDEFIATPVISHLIQTIGEWLGITITIMGIGVSLIGSIFDYTDRLIYVLDLPDIFNTSLWGLIIAPVTGLLVLIILRLLSEQIKALVSIANNTKK